MHAKIKLAALVVLCAGRILAADTSPAPFPVTITKHGWAALVAASFQEERPDVRQKRFSTKTVEALIQEGKQR